MANRCLVNLKAEKLSWKSREYMQELIRLAKIRSRQLGIDTKMKGEV